MLQNRVDPFGKLIMIKERGAWMGNRGILHNDQQEVLRAFKLKAWLTCKLEFNGRKREVMAPNRYTELFFMDEATAFAAGHRPCFECRREDYSRFKSCWLKGNPQCHFDEKTSIQKIDNILHAERIAAGNTKITYQEKPKNIPNGAFILFNDRPFLVFNNKMFLWSASGYAVGMNLPEENTVTVLTPRSVVNCFRAGYLPQINLP